MLFDCALRGVRQPRRDGALFEPAPFVRRVHAIWLARVGEHFTGTEIHVIERRMHCNAGRLQRGRYRCVTRDGVRLVVFVEEELARADSRAKGDEFLREIAV